MRSTTTRALALCAGLAVTASVAHAQFAGFSGTILLDGAPATPSTNYNGLLQLGSPSSGAGLVVDSGNSIDHVGDMVLSAGAGRTTSISLSGAQTSWTTTGNISIDPATMGGNHSIALRNGSTFILNGNFDGTLPPGASNSVGNIQIQVSTGASIRINGSVLLGEGDSISSRLGNGDVYADSIELGQGASLFTQEFGLIETLALTVNAAEVTLDREGQLSTGITELNSASVDLRRGNSPDPLSAKWDATSMSLSNTSFDVRTEVFLDVEGALTLDPSSSIVIDGGRIDAGFMTFNDFSALSASSLGGELNIGLVTLGNAGQTTTDLTAVSIPGVTTTLGGISNDGIIASAFFDNTGFSGDYRNSATGELRLREGDAIEVVSFTNAGEVNLLGRATAGGSARIDTPGAFDNQAGAILFAQEAELRADDGFTNAGTMAFSFGRSSLLGDVDNTGLITLSGGSEVTFFDDVTNNGTINLAQGGSLTGATTVFGTYSGAGDVTGGGDLFLLGDVQIGNSPAAVEWDASLFLGLSTDTLIEIAGSDIGDFDRINLTGDLVLAGDFDVALLDGFLLEENMSFEIFRAQGSMSGAFRGLAEGDLVGSYNGVDLFITYDNGLGGVALFSVPTPGAAALLVAAGLFTRRRRA